MASENGRMVIKYPRPPLNLVGEGLAPNGVNLDGVNLYVGDMAAAANDRLLADHGITTVINCAINTDIDFVERHYEPVPPPDVRAYGYAAFRYYKLGLVDGPGNPPELMLAGYLMLDGAIRQTLPEKPSYPNRERGNVLVFCRAGRSRSIAVAAMYLHLRLPERYPDLADAIAHVRACREIRPDEFFEAPNPDLIEAAQWACARAKVL